jgi:hypothetical protein
MFRENLSVKEWSVFIHYSSGNKHAWDRVQLQPCANMYYFILFLSISWMDEYGIWFGFCGFLRLGTSKTTECHFSWARNSMVSGSPTSCGSVEVLRKRSGGGEDAGFTSSCGSDFLPIHPQNWVVSASICWDKTQTDKARTVTIMFWAWSVWR